MKEGDKKEGFLLIIMIGIIALACTILGTLMYINSLLYANIHSHVIQEQRYRSAEALLLYAIVACKQSQHTLVTLPSNQTIEIPHWFNSLQKGVIEIKHKNDQLFIRSLIYENDTITYALQALVNISEQQLDIIDWNITNDSIQVL